MKTKTKKKEQPPPKFQIDGDAVVRALRKSQIPNNFVKPGVRLDTFPWGAAMRDWMEGELADAFIKGKSVYLTCKPDQGLAACAMLVRSLVLRGRDALFATLPDLIGAPEPVRKSDYLVIAGFYDDDFHSAKGCPMTPSEAFKLSWALWRLANSGTVVVAQIWRGPSSVGNWWLAGAVDNMFNQNHSISIR